MHHGGGRERPDDAGERTRPGGAHVPAEQQEGPSGEVGADGEHGGVEHPLRGRRAAADAEQRAAADERGADRAAQDHGRQRRDAVGGPGQAARVEQGGGGFAGDQEQAERADLDPVKPPERARGDHCDGGGDH